MVDHHDKVDNMVTYAFLDTTSTLFDEVENVKDFMKFQMLQIGSRSGCKDHHITYVFHMRHYYEYERRQRTDNYIICVKGEIDFYRILEEIIEMKFSELLKTKYILFKCEWFNPSST